MENKYKINPFTMCSGVTMSQEYSNIYSESTDKTKGSDIMFLGLVLAFVMFQSISSHMDM